MILSETAEQREEALLRRFRIVTKLTAINFIRSVWQTPQSFGSAFLHPRYTLAQTTRRRLRSSFNFDFSENRKVIRETESDNASRLWYTFIVVNFVKKVKIP